MLISPGCRGSRRLVIAQLLQCVGDDVAGYLSDVWLVIADRTKDELPCSPPALFANRELGVTTQYAALRGTKRA